MIKQYYLTPIMVVGLGSGLLSGIPGVCCGSFLVSALAGMLAVWWGNSRGGQFTGLGTPTLVGLAVGGVGMFLAGGIIGGFILIAVEMAKSDPKAAADLAKLPANARALVPVIYGLVNAGIFVAFATLGGLVGGFLWADKGAPPPPPPGYGQGYPPAWPAPGDQAGMPPPPVAPASQGPTGMPPPPPRDPGWPSSPPPSPPVPPGPPVS